MGFFVPRELLRARLALTSPFQPCLLKKRTALLSNKPRCLFCDTFRQRPLSRTLPAYSTRHAAVWCSDFPPANLAIHQRSSAIGRIVAHSVAFAAASRR